MTPAPSTPRLFTSESVTEGHPDKLADQISDAVLDKVLAEDPKGRVACETFLAKGMALVAGEISTHALPDVAEIARETILAAGYTSAAYGLDGDTCAVVSALGRQSLEIGAGVDKGGAGDQGMMFGYACDDTPELMPAPITYAHKLVRRLSEARRSGELPWLRPDGKAQVTFECDDDLRPQRVTTIVVSAQHEPDVSRDQIEDAIKGQVVAPVIPANFMDPGQVEYHINPSGSFVEGGPHADAGLTGRKIIVDTYGGMGRHGGGAFSGKDATKVDRSGAYAARWAAKNLVAAGAARRCEVQLAYAIGVEQPVQVYVDSFGTGSRPDAELSRAVGEVFDFSPRAIAEALGLRAPIFLPTATFGHFGREPETARERQKARESDMARAPETARESDTADAEDRPVQYFSWERTDRVDDLKTALEL